MSTQRFDPTEAEADPVSSTGMTVTGWQACLHRESWQGAEAL